AEFAGHRGRRTTGGLPESEGFQLELFGESLSFRHRTPPRGYCPLFEVSTKVGLAHLSSYLSGRGIVRLLRFMAETYSGDRADSMLGPTVEDEALVINFVQAVRAGDVLGTRVLDFAAAKLAYVIQRVSG